MPDSETTSQSAIRRSSASLVIPLVLFILTLLYRWPDHATTVFDWDNIQYLLALERFDVLAHQPHPPGNPLYVFAGRILRKINEYVLKYGKYIIFVIFMIFGIIFVHRGILFFL